ncbi:hypothetical protein BASA83_013760 [Batrachochytrium salamandrivorans]|nr:hypothetical protein BASA83_013760 [Batrachochytrium salamandrivorans]
MRLQATEVLSTVTYVQPSSLVNLSRLKHGVTFSYSSAWRALQCHRQDISKADVISFGKIPYFLHEIEIVQSWLNNLCCSNLKEAIPEIKQPGVVIVHDREKDLQQAQKQVLPFSFESICCLAPRKELSIQYSNPSLNSDPKRWAKNYFPVPRFGTVTLNSAKSLNSWMEEYRDKSHLEILAFWVSHSTCLLYSRKQEYANAYTVLSPRSFRTFNQNRDNGRRHQMFQTGDHLFEVASLTSGYTRMIVSVDLDTIDCDETLQPPNVVRKTGRPRKVCLQSRGEVDDNDRYACKGCGLRRHNV